MERKVFIATPCFGAQVSCFFTQSLIETIDLLKRHGIDSKVAFMPNQIVTRARNLLTQDFMESDCTHLFFIDADIQWNPMDVLRLLEHQKPIVVGLYPNKCYQYRRMFEEQPGFVVENESQLSKGIEYSSRFKANHNKLHNDWLIELEYGATGFMLIERDVITKLQQHVDSYKHPEQQDKRIHDLFNCRVVDGDYLTEDYYFCYLWKEKCGGTIWADISICLNHEGWHSFRGNPMESFQLLKE